jgi:hypothetical protein
MSTYKLLALFSGLRQSAVTSSPVGTGARSLWPVAHLAGLGDSRDERRKIRDRFWSFFLRHRRGLVGRLEGVTTPHAHAVIYVTW